LTKRIAVAGKGGTGKTTFAALLIKNLIEDGKTPILAVDADANANLNEALGLEVKETIGRILDQTKERGAVPAGMTKETFIQYRLNAALSESKDVDLLVMGGPEGPGCYCYPNDLLKKHMEDLAVNYPYVVMDNEAGLEHLSRRTAGEVDVLYIVSDATARGIRSAARAHQLVRSLKTKVGQMHLVVTKTTGNELEALAGEIEKVGLPVAGTMPYDQKVADYDLHGRPLVDLPGDSPAVEAVKEIWRKTEV